MSPANKIFVSLLPLHVLNDANDVMAGIENIEDLGQAAIQNRIRCAALADSVMLQCITVRPCSHCCNFACMTNDCRCIAKPAFVICLPMDRRF